jgi:hypothetical protein
MDDVPKRIHEIVEGLRDGEKPRKYRVRAVLKWFGASRRGANVLSDIKTTLANVGLEVDPPLDDAKIDDRVRFTLVSVEAPNTLREAPSTSQAGPAAVDDPPPAIATPQTGVNGIPETMAASEDLLEPETDEEQPIVKPDDRPVTSQSSDWTISALRDKLDRGQLDLQPKFQREYVWNLRPELPSRLIESLLLEIPIPPIYFGKVSEGRLEWGIHDLLNTPWFPRQPS